MKTPENLVFVDTCIWASFFQKPSSPEKNAADHLIDENRVAIVGPLITEILIGFPRKEQADWVASRLKLLHRPEIEWEDWRSAATLGSDSIGRGHKLPLTDLVLAVVAIRLEIAVYTSDPHFGHISDLKRFSP